MTTSSPTQPPNYRHYRPKNLGDVRIEGKDHYLGKYEPPESLERYHQLLETERRVGCDAGADP